jgi:hypothetical protein
MRQYEFLKVKYFYIQLYFREGGYHIEINLTKSKKYNLEVRLSSCTYLSRTFNF